MRTAAGIPDDYHPLSLVAGMDYLRFRAVLLPVDPQAGTVLIPPDCAARLQIAAGDPVRVVSLSPQGTCL